MITVLEKIIHSITLPIRIISNWIIEYSPGLRNVKRLSIPWRWAILSLVFLLLVWMGAYASHWFPSKPDKQGPNWFYWFLLPSPALVVVPFLVYHFVRLWMIREESPFPDIDQAWYDGLNKCDAAGLDILDTPIFLVMGASTSSETRNLMQSSRLRWDVEMPGDSGTPLGFYGNNRGLFVFLNGCCQVSQLNHLRLNGGLREETSVNGSNESRPSQGELVRPTATLDASFFAGSPEASRPQPTPTLQAPSGDANFAIGGTLVLSGDGNAPMEEAAKTIIRQLPTEQARICERRLAYLCKLIRDARKQYVPINGVLTLMPLELVESLHEAAQGCLQSDSRILLEQLDVRVPNTLLISGMEEDEGFVELMKRLKEKQVQESRFGKGSELWAIPELDRFRALTVLAVSQFEEWIYMLFRTHNMSDSRNNQRLFSLLCRVRGDFVEKLEQIVVNGFGSHPTSKNSSSQAPLLFGGCYFAATGARPHLQGFVQGVISKLFEQEAELEWTDEAIEADRRSDFLGNLLIFFGLMAVVLALIFAYWYGNVVGE